MTCSVLGHSKPSITLDVYGQLWEAQHADLVRRQDEALEKIVPKEIARTA